MTDQATHHCGVDGDKSFWCMEPEFVGRLWVVFYFLAVLAAGNTYFWIMGPSAMNDQGLPTALISIDQLFCRILGLPYNGCRQLIIKGVSYLEEHLLVFPRIDYDRLYYKFVALDEMLQRIFGKFYKVPQQRISPWLVRFIIVIMLILGNAEECLGRLKRRYISRPHEACQGFVDARYRVCRRALRMTDWHIQHLRYRRDVIGFSGAARGWARSTRKVADWHSTRSQEDTPDLCAGSHFLSGARTTDSQKQCLLLSRLPLELREMIYREVLTSAHELCIGDVGEPVVLPHRGNWRGETFRRETLFCRSTSKQRKDNLQRGRRGPGRIQVPSGSQRKKTSLLSGKTLSLFLKHGKVSLLCSCRMIYREAIDMLYSLNTFHFHDGRRLIRFLAPLPAHRISLIKISIFLGLRAEVLWLNGGIHDLDGWLDMWTYFESNQSTISSLTIRIAARSYHYLYHHTEDHLGPVIRSSIPITLIFSGDEGPRQKSDTIVDIHLVREQVLGKGYSRYHKLNEEQARSIHCALLDIIGQAIHALLA